MNYSLSRLLPNDSKTYKWGRKILITSLELLVIVGVYKILSTVFFSRFGEEPYHNEVILLGIVSISKRILVLTVFTFAVAIYAHFKGLHKNIWEGNPLYYFYATCIIILIWAYAFYDFNYYLDKFHLLDRLLLIGLGIYALYNPIAIVPFVAQAYFIAFQFNYPSCFSYTFTDKKIIYDILMTFGAFFYVKLLYRKLPWSHVFFLSLGIIASWYFLAAWGKQELNWVENNNLSYLFSAAYIHNWLHWVDEVTISNIYTFLNKYDNLIEIFTLITEFAPLLLLINRKLTAALLFSFATMHIGIYLSSGIFFWKWIVIELVMVVLLLREKNMFKEAYALPYAILFIPALVFLYPSVYSKVKLAWLDSGFVQKYTFEVHDKANKPIELDPAYFKPFDVNFAQNRFHFIQDENVLVGTYGASMDTKFIQALKSFSGDSIHLETLKTEYGKNYFDESKRLALHKFLTIFINNKEARGEESKILNFFSPPMHIIQKGDIEVNIDDPERLDIRFMEFHMEDPYGIDTLSNSVLLSIPLQPNKLGSYN